MSRVGETGVGKTGIGETGVGEMGVVETGTNRFSSVPQACVKRALNVRCAPVAGA